jgi:uncharacterized protein (DUF2336 family)
MDTIAPPPERLAAAAPPRPPPPPPERPAAAPPRPAARPPARASLEGLGEAVRVRLGTAPDTAQDVLRELAGDPSVTVRAAVAMNMAASEQADLLLARDQDERVRTLLGRKLASLIPGIATPYRAQLEGHALRMLAALVEDEAVRVRAAIADVVKEMPAAPRELILRLARDSALPVSGPVIRLSPLLSVGDLLGLLADAPGDETAAAVASRPGLPATVADAIAASADGKLIAILLANRSAAIREATLDALIARAASQPDWHDPLVRRPALSARAARALSDIVATQLVAVLAARGDLDPETTRDLQRRLGDRLPPPHTGPLDPTLEIAVGRARKMLLRDELDETAVLAAAQRGEARLCTAMLAAAAGVDATVVDRAVTLRSAKGIVSLIWKAGFSMRLAGPLQVLLCRAGPGTALRGVNGGGFPLGTEEMRWQLELLHRMAR